VRDERVAIVEGKYVAACGFLSRQFCMAVTLLAHLRLGRRLERMGGGALAASRGTEGNSQVNIHDSNGTVLG